MATILQAATQVLAQEGAGRFTTARVAEKAGVSVGSVYQYFPNKAAILFRLQSDEWRQTQEMLSRILEDQARPPLARLRALVHAFVRSECEEAEMRVALSDAAPLYRDAPEAREARAAGEETFRAFMREVMPKASPADLALVGGLISTTLSAVGKVFQATRAARRKSAPMRTPWRTCSAPISPTWRTALERRRAAPALAAALCGSRNARFDQLPASACAAGVLPDALQSNGSWLAARAASQLRRRSPRFPVPGLPGEWR